MKGRVQVFAFEFAAEFEKILRQEIASVDALEKCRVPGVLVARGLVAPVLVACWKALRRALSAEKSRTLTASRSFESTATSTVSHP